MKKVADFGRAHGWAGEVEPPVCLLKASATFGTEIPEAAWREIRLAFNRHGRRLQDLETSTRANNNKNDPSGWHNRKGNLTRRLETALAAMEAIDVDFLLQAEELAELALPGCGADYECAGRLAKALEEIRCILWVMEHSAPIERQIMSEAESREALARDVFDILKPFGARLSNGWKIELGDRHNADLSGFEKLIELLEIHQGTTRAATAKWLRKATALNSPPPAGQGSPTIAMADPH